MTGRETAKKLIGDAQAAVLSVLVRNGDIPPLRALYCPNYLRELLAEVVRGDDGYYISLTVPKRAYGWYKRRTPKNRAIPPEVDVKTLEAVFALFLPNPFRVVAVRNSLENVVIFLDQIGG